MQRVRCGDRKWGLIRGKAARWPGHPQRTLFVVSGGAWARSNAACSSYVLDQMSRSTINSRLINVTTFEISVTICLCSESCAKQSCVFA